MQEHDLTEESTNPPGPVMQSPYALIQIDSVSECIGKWGAFGDGRCDGRLEEIHGRFFHGSSLSARSSSRALALLDRHSPVFCDSVVEHWTLLIFTPVQIDMQIAVRNLYTVSLHSSI